MNEKLDEEILSRLKDTSLFFSKDVFGKGDLNCLLCGHIEQLNGSKFTQCEECWEIQKVSDKIMCGCGGKVEQDKPVFCPKCHSYSVQFTKSNDSKF